MSSGAFHRPRNLDWKRAAGLLYGDWGTSKAYVIGLAFLTASYTSLPMIILVSLLTGLVGYNYTVVCKHFPDGGGVYSAARDQSRNLAVMGALLLVANFTVTAALSGWSAMQYFKVHPAWIGPATMLLIAVVGLINLYGPKHTGSLAVTMAVPMMVVVLAIVALSIPYLTTDYLQPLNPSFGVNWQYFTGMILALSGVEAIANLTGVMKLDSGSTVDHPSVVSTSRKAIWPVAIEVVIGTSLLGWAMLSIPPNHYAGQPPASQAELRPAAPLAAPAATVLGDAGSGSSQVAADSAPASGRRAIARSSKTQAQVADYMVRHLAEYYGELTFGKKFGKLFGILVGILVGLLLLSAVNTAVSALIGLIYTLARDGEMPRALTRLNHYGVPRWPLAISVLLPIFVVVLSPGLESLANLYAIGVVGAIAVNLGSCTFNLKLSMTWLERGVMCLTFFVLFAVELTIAKTKPDALFFACCILGIGLAVRSFSQKRAGMRTVTVPHQVAAAVAPESFARLKLNLQAGQSIMVAARGATPILRFAMEEAALRQATLYVLYVRELAVNLPGPLTFVTPLKWENNPEAAEIMYGMLELGQKNGVTVVPLYAVSEDPAGTILDLAATIGVDMLILGASHRHRLVSILKGDVVIQVARSLPENIQLVLHG